MENLQQQLAEQCRLGAEKDSKIEALSMMLSLSSKISLDDSSDKLKVCKYVSLLLGLYSS